MLPAIRPDVVEVLAVAQAWVEMKFVEAGAASKDQFVTEVRIVGDLYDLVELGEVLFELVGVDRGSAIRTVLASSAIARAGIIGRAVLRC
jgi:hypothetical protein